MKPHLSFTILLCYNFIKFNEELCVVFQHMIYETGSITQVFMKQNGIQGSITNKTGKVEKEYFQS